MTDLALIAAEATPFCTFRLEERLYGIAVSHVREVSRCLEVTPAPQAPTAIRGLANLRSRIYLVLDPRPLLGLAPLGYTAENRLIILKSEVGQDVGILVQRGGDIVQVRTDQIERAAGVTEMPDQTQSPLITGVCKLETELMMIIDPIRLVDATSKLFR